MINAGSVTPRWLAITAVASTVMAVVAAGLASWALLRPVPTPDAPSHSAGEIATATTTVCQAYELARRGVSLQTNATPPAGQSGELAAGANARLALLTASVTLTDTLDTAPATPSALATAATHLATEYRGIAANYLAGVTSGQAPITTALTRANAAATTIDGICPK